MQKQSLLMIVCGLMAVSAGCATSPEARNEPSGSGAAQKSTPAAHAAAPAAKSAPSKFTAANNPTILAGRGEPSLEERSRPAAWIFVDGKGGKFTSREGEPLTQWIIDGPVSSSPTFRVEGYEPLLGNPKDFKYVLQAVDSSGSTTVVYGIAANEGTFAPGRDYPLLNPGENFVIRNGFTGDIVKEISPLPPGTYAIVGGLENTSTGKRALTVSYFTVAADQ